MGVCCTKEEESKSPEFEYKNEVFLEIGSLYASVLSQLPVDSIYKLPSPVLQDKINIFLSNLPFKVSGCVIPGIDFRPGQSKICQDNFLFLVHNNTLLAVLCDGHGAEGQTIAKFSLDYIQKLFKKHFLKIKHEPKAAFSFILNRIDAKILAKPESELSGSTVVVVFISDGHVFTASLGDSRAVLGQLSQTPDIAKVRNNKYFRRIVNERPFKAIQLTIDQKPEHPEEEQRIKNAGGLVQKFVDPFGRSVGPFRVWKSDGTGPGLAMSRSLGDKIAKICGVSSEAIAGDRKIVPGKDNYIVLGSDGIWDMMDNIEVVNFVDRFRGECVGDGADYPANFNNSSISRLLCEEARYRWLGLAQEERVAIDDISCIVIDFGVSHNTESMIESEGEKKLVTIEHSEELTN